MSDPLTLPGEVICPGCRQPVSSQDNFCRYCGARIPSVQENQRAENVASHSSHRLTCLLLLSIALLVLLLVAVLVLVLWPTGWQWVQELFVAPTPTAVRALPTATPVQPLATATAVAPLPSATRIPSLIVVPSATAVSPFPSRTPVTPVSLTPTRKP